MMIVLVLGGCFSSRRVSAISPSLARSQTDTSYYEVMIVDPRFDLWYTQNYSDVKDRMKEYYQASNLAAVSNWNHYYNTGKYSGLIESPIDYRPEVDYGIEVDRKLYWFFRYISETYGIRLFIL